MVRWRLCLALAIMLLLPIMISGKNNDDDDDEDSENKEDFRLSKIPKPKYQQHSRRSEENEEEEEEEDEDDDDGGDEKNGNGGGGGIDRAERQESLPIPGGRHASLMMATPKSSGMTDSRSPKRRPLECYVCAYKSETPLRACLDPTKFRVHTITCHSVDDRCFTSVISKGETYEAVVRGCRSGCVGSAETTCCELNRCNNQAFAMPVIQPRVEVLKTHVPVKSKTSKCLPPTIVFFITILLILQTVGKVAFV